MQFKKVALLVLLQTIFFSTVSWGQTYLVKNYNENDGLGSSIVNDVKQDTTGRMWFATRTGISVYDGYEWKSFNQNDGLQSMTFFRLKVDEKGIVWGLSIDRPSISYFLKSKWHHIPVKTEIQNETGITSFELFYLNDEIILFIGTLQSGLYCYRHGAWERLTIKDGLLSNRINHLVVMERKLYIATNNGISIFDGQKIENLVLRDFPSKRITALAVEKPGVGQPSKERLWIHGYYWLGYLEAGRLKLFSQNAKIKFEPDNPFLILQPDSHGGVFLASLFDIFYLKGKNSPKLHIGRERGIISEGATALFIDREKNIWISTRRGVSKIISRRFTNFRKTDKLLEDEVSAILEYRPNEFIFGHGNGYTLYSDKGISPRAFIRDKLESEYTTRVLDLKLDRDNNIWIAASHMGLGRLSPDSSLNFFGKKDGLPGNVTSVIEFEPGQLLISTPNLIYLYDGTRFSPFNIDFIKKNVSTPSFRKLFKDRQGNIYFCSTANGIFIWRDGKWDWILHESQNVNSVYSICQDKKNRIWVGTLAGVYLFNKKNKTLVKSTEVAIDRPAYLIFEDYRKRLWIGTDKGVFRWDGTNKIHYTSNEGLVGQEVNRSAGLSDYSDRIWIGCDMGVSCYEEKFDYQVGSIPPPKVEVTYLDLGIDTLLLVEDNKISYDKKLFIFQFRGISFVNEQQVSYRTKLEGFDEDFTYHPELENPFVRYTNLPSGRYRFLVQAKSKLSDWSNIISSGEIIIQEPFWRTTKFTIGVSIFPVLLIVVIVLIRLSVLKKQKHQQEAFARRLIEEIENERKVISQDLHDSIGQELIITKNQLQTLSTRLEKPSEVKAKLSDLETMIANIIQGVRELLYRLHPHILEQLGFTKAIESIIKRVVQSTKINFSWELHDINTIFPKQLQIHIFRIIQEGLTNIVKHSGASQARIQVKIMDKLLSVLIQDDGKGFEYKPLHFKPESGGFGLNSIYERVKILKGTCRIYSAPAQGTSIKITIPIEWKNNE